MEPTPAGGERARVERRWGCGGRRGWTARRQRAKPKSESKPDLTDIHSETRRRGGRAGDGPRCTDALGAGPRAATAELRVGAERDGHGAALASGRAPDDGDERGRGRSVISFFFASASF